MKRYLIVLFLPIFLSAKSLYLSDLPLPVTEIINLQIKSCDKECLDNYLKTGDVFFFVSNFNPKKVADSNLTNYYEELKTKLNIMNITSNKKVKLALLVPKNIIGRYAISTANSILAYLLSKNIDFQLELFDSKDESLEHIKKSVDDIEQSGYRFVIAPLTALGAKNLLLTNSNLTFYIPTVNKNDIKTELPNYLFGGIDYQKQIDKLMLFTNDKIAVFSDESSIGYKLLSYIENSSKHIVYKKIIPQKTTKFRPFLRRNRRLNESSIFLNTPLVKTSLLASQFRFYKISPYALFSTQISYNPLLLSLTQYQDRKRFYIANSIGHIDDKLEVINRLLDNNIKFDWINFSTSIGTDYIYTFYFGEQPERTFSENIVNNQVNYSISIVKPTKSKFEKISFMFDKE